MVKPDPKQPLVIRTGCLSCRARGRACDPNDAACKRGVSTCWDANRPVNRRRQKRPIHYLGAGWPLGTVSIITLDHSWEGTSREKQSLHFFCVITAPELAGYFDGIFWRRTLLQATQLDDAIKHAVAALGAIHEYQLRRQAARYNAQTDELQSFALRQCNKAINELVKPEAQTEDILRALTASVLFSCFENMNDNQEAAIPHIVHARRMSQQYRQQGLASPSQTFRPKWPIQFNVVEPLVRHYEVQIEDGTDDGVPRDHLNSSDIAGAVVIHCFTDARMLLEQAIANLSVVVCDLEEHHSPGDIKAFEMTRSSYASWFRRWDAAFTDFLAERSSHMDKDIIDGCRVLKAHQTAGLILATVDYLQGEEAWAGLTSDFKAILELAAEVVAGLPSKGLSSRVPQTPYLSAGMGLTEPLYVTASRCADPIIVRKAHSLISRLPHSEGIYSAWRISFLEANLCAATGKYHDTATSTGSSHASTEFIREDAD